MKKIALYARVSTDKQSCENQLIELRATASRMSFEVIQEFVDNGISGAKERQDRPALDTMMKMATQRRFYVVMVRSIDRLGRSLQHLIELLNELHSMNIDLFFQQQLITTTPTGKMMFSIMGALGAYERDLIRARVKQGLEVAKSKGVKLGRPSNITESTKTAVKLLVEKGRGSRDLSTPRNWCL